MLASCSSSSGKRKPRAVAETTSYRDVPFRAHHTWISTVSFDRITSDHIEIIYADSAFRAGDTILVGGTKEYILQQRVQ